MPELPEVETTVRGLAAVLSGARITGLITRRADLRRPFPADLVQSMTGATITALSRRAKYGIISTDRDAHMIFHLGMSGRWRIDPVDHDRHDHLELRTDAHRIALNDPRRFGSVDLVQGDWADWDGFARLGPEPLSDAFTARALTAALTRRSGPIKTTLLDQKVVAGLGNIYVCEALHRTHIHPDTPSDAIKGAKATALVAAIQAVLHESIAAGGSTIRDYAQPDGQLGYFAKDWAVYGRTGAPCACGGVVQRTVHAGRSTFFCPKCQKKRAAHRGRG